MSKDVVMRSGTGALVIGYFLVYLAMLGVRPMIAPDETRYGEIPREMLASGDWVVPHLDGLRYFEKPIMGHWLNGAALMLFGDNAFAVRLASALATGFSGWLLLLWARKYSEDQVVPLFATAVFWLSVLVFGLGTFAVLDAMLALFTTAAIVAFYFGYQEQVPGRRLLYLVLAGAACGCAFLTKGFIALVIPASVIVPFASWQGWLKRCLRTAWVPVLSAVLISLPWSLLIHGRAPDFWHYFFWVEHVNRFISPSGGQHPEPIWYYLPILLAGIMPWTVLAGPIVQGLRQTSFQHPLVRLAVCWFVFPFLFFSVCGGKLATYILPCFPPVAFLIAVGVVNCLRAGKVKGFIVGAWVLVSVAVLLLVALAVGLFVMPRLTVSVPLWRWSIVACGLVACGVLGRLAITASTVNRRLIFFSLAPVLVLFSLPLVTHAAIKTSKAPGKFLRSQSTKVPRHGIIVCRAGLAASVCWYYQRSDVILFGSKGEYEYGLSYADSKHRYLDLEGFKDLLSKPDAGGLITLIVTGNEYEVMAKLLPEPVVKEVSQNLVFAQFAVPTADPTSPAPSNRPAHETPAD